MPAHAVPVSELKRFGEDQSQLEVPVHSKSGNLVGLRDRGFSSHREREWDIRETSGIDVLESLLRRVNSLAGLAV